MVRPQGKKQASADSDGHLAITDREFDQLRQLIYSHTGISLSDHKRALVCSRLGKRLRHHGMTNYDQYYSYLIGRDPGGKELLEMINAITTNKTDFFREAHHFTFLASQVFPAYQKARRGYGDQRQMRLWSAGTSTGEEAYTLAMTTCESFPVITSDEIRILATDIATDVLEHGRRGIYTMEQAKHIPSKLLHRYFLKGRGGQEGNVMAKQLLKSLISFRRLNLKEHPWPMRQMFDVVFCRNVIIYFDKSTQLQIVRRFAHTLKPGGYLMLGHSESLHGLKTGFTHIGHSIYQYQGRS